MIKRYYGTFILPAHHKLPPDTFFQKSNRRKHTTTRTRTTTRTITRTRTKTRTTTTTNNNNSNNSNNSNKNNKLQQTTKPPATISQHFSQNACSPPPTETSAEAPQPIFRSCHRAPGRRQSNCFGAQTK